MIKLHADMQRCLQQMRCLTAAFEKELGILPQGSLSVRKQNSKLYYYCNIWSGGKKQKFYLKLSSKRDRKLLKKLKRRRFIQQCLPLLKADILALEQALKKFRPYDPEKICAELSSAYQEIEKDPTLWLPAEPSLKKWAKEPYDRYIGHPESLIHETSAGLMVRSKAESMIADTLTLYGVPFRYEQKLKANGETYAPDFTILTRQLMYWEHFGKMDDADYVLNNAVKIMNYRQAGIRLGDNLLLTVEDSSHPLTMREIQDMIQLRLLPS